MKALINRAYNIFSTNYPLTNELKHLENVLQNRNGYLNWVIKQILKISITKRKCSLSSNMVACSSDKNLCETSSAEVAHVTLPSKGKVFKIPQKQFKSLFPKEVETRIVYTGTKLRSQLARKDIT